MSSYQFKVTVGGRVFPADNINVTSGSFGSCGHMGATTSISALNALGIDLFEIVASAAAPVEVYVDVTVDSNAPARIFGGEFVTDEWDYDGDRVTIHARDWAGQLMDQKRVLTTIATQVTKLLAPLAPGQNPDSLGTSNVNQTLAQVVTSIAQEFSMTPVLNLTGATSGSTALGTLYGTGDQTFLAVPQSLWAILSQLARDTGYDVYVTPDRKLVFGTPGTGITPLKITWKVNPPTAGAIVSRRLHIDHHPRRNATFRVLVFSYDAGRGQQTTGTAVSVGSNLAGSAGLRPGIWAGQDAVQANAQFAQVKDYGGGVTVAQVPLYSFRVDGLNADQANTKALSLATDIAKRELILSAEIDGFPGATPTQKVNISGAIDPNFSGNDYYLTAYTHRFRMPAPGESSFAGFVTELKALDIPLIGRSGGEGPVL